MESIKQWFQDWFDACEYAKECVPDLSFVVPQEPYSAFAGIAAACFFFWWRNERQINRRRDYERQVHAKGELQAVETGKLALAPDQMKTVRLPPKKQAA